MDRSQEGYGDAELRPAECGGEPHGCAAPDDEESLRREAEADGGEVEEGDELYEHFAVDVDRGQEPMRLDKFLTLRMQHCSRNRIQTAVDSGSVLVGGRPAKSSYKVKPLDRITVVMPYPKREVEIVPQNIPLDIPYEDDDLLIVDKPAGMVVHPGHGNWDGTLVNALTYHLRTLPMFREGDLRAGLVHRIDKDTSGLLVVAKNERAHARLAKQFFDHTIVRRYYALVWGNPDADEGTIEGNIGRSPKDKLQMCVFADGEQGKHAVTHWRVVRRYGYVTLVECRLETGRTWRGRVSRSSTTPATAAPASSKGRPSRNTASSSRTVSRCCPGRRCTPVVWDSYTPRRGARSTSRANCRPISAPCSTGGRITPHTYAPTPNRQYSPRRCRYRG